MDYPDAASGSLAAASSGGPETTEDGPSGRLGLLWGWQASRAALVATAPIAWELTLEAETALDALGEPVDLPTQCSRCHAEEASTRHPDRLGARCISAELFGDSDDAA